MDEAHHLKESTLGQTFLSHFTAETQANSQLMNAEYHPDDHLHQKRQEEFEDSAGGSQALNRPYNLQGVVWVFTGMFRETQVFGVSGRASRE